MCGICEGVLLTMICSPMETPQFFTHSWLTWMFKPGRLREQHLQSHKENCFLSLVYYYFFLSWSVNRNFHLVEEWKIWGESLCPFFWSLAWLGRGWVKVQPFQTMNSAWRICSLEGNLGFWLTSQFCQRWRQFSKAVFFGNKVDHFRSADLGLTPQWIQNSSGKRCD